jgi:hypothetical protein
VKNYLNAARRNARFDSRRIRRSSLLKWLNSLYRPAWPEGIRGGEASPAAFRAIYWGVAKW